MTDDMYEHIAYPPFVFSTPAEVEPRLHDRTLTVNGVSKAYAMTGWRIGYAAGPLPLIRAMVTIQSQSTSNACSISQWAAVEALNGPQDYIAESAQAFRRRRDLVVGRAQRLPRHHMPGAGGRLLRLSLDRRADRPPYPTGERIDSDEDFASALLASEGVAVVFGAAFGLSPNFRISYAAADEVLSEACRRIRRFCESLA